MKKEKISIIVPCYNEEDAITYFYEEIIKISEKMKKVDFEYLFINDGSKDKTLQIVKELREKDKRVRYVSFSRNFGKEAAMYAGLKEAEGDYVAFMDADLQDPPTLIPEMYDLICNEGYDVVAARSVSRHGYGFFRKFCTKMFYKIINKMAQVEMVDGARDFRLMTRQVVDAMLSMEEYNRYTKGIFSFVGFDVKWIEYENIERVAGETKWSFWKLFTYALEGITSFSTTPLVLSAIVGVLLCLVAFIMIIVIICKTLIWGDPVGGWPSLACIIFFVSGIQLFCLGISGQYLSKTYLETKKRPLYIIKETEKTPKRKINKKNA